MYGTCTSVFHLQYSKATGIASFTRVEIVCNMADLHTKYTQKMYVKFFLHVA